MKSLNLLLIISVILISTINSCNENDDDYVTIKGTVRYLDTNSPIKMLPVRLNILNLDIPNNLGDRTNSSNNIAYTNFVTTDNNGTYTHVFKKSILPKNLSIGVLIENDTLSEFNQLEPCTFSFYFNNIPNNNLIIKDFIVSNHSYLKISILKKEPVNNSKIRLMLDNCFGYLFESNIEKPDTVINRKLSYFKNRTIDINYFVYSNDNVGKEFIIKDIPLIKNDTAKISIEY